MSAGFIDLLVVVSLLVLGTYLTWIVDTLFAEDLAILVYGDGIKLSKPRRPNGMSATYPANVTRWFFALMLVTVMILSVVNTVVVQGRTGRSLGKLVTGLRVVDPHAHRPVGVGRGFRRQLAHSVDAFPFCLGFLWPLFDTRRRTFADMLTRTIVVRGREPVPAQIGQRSPRDLAPWFITALCTVAAYTLITIVAWLYRWGP